MVYALQIEVCRSRAVFFFPSRPPSRSGKPAPAAACAEWTHDYAQVGNTKDEIWTCERGVGLPAVNLVWRGVGVKGGREEEAEGWSAMVEMRVIWCGHDCFRTGRGPDAEEESLPRVHPFMLSQIHFWEDTAACTVPEVGTSRSQESQKKPQQAVWNKKAESKRGWKCETS